MPDGSEIKHGDWNQYYENGLPYLEAEYINGVRHGPVRSWHRNGTLRGMGQYDHGNKTGKWTHYDDAGRKQREYFQLNDAFHSLWTGWDERGRSLKPASTSRGRPDQCSRRSRIVVIACEELAPVCSDR